MSSVYIEIILYIRENLLQLWKGDSDKNGWGYWATGGCGRGRMTRMYVRCQYVTSNKLNLDSLQL